MRLLCFDLATEAEMLYAVAAIYLISPSIIGILAPGALSTSMKTVTAMMACYPSFVDLSSSTAAITLTAYKDGYTQGPSAAMSRLVAQTVSSGYSLPPSPCGDVCGYSISIAAPFFQCKPDNNFTAPFTVDAGNTLLWSANTDYIQSQAVFRVVALNSSRNLDATICYGMNATYIFDISQNGSTSSMDLKNITQTSPLSLDLADPQLGFSGSSPADITNTPNFRSTTNFVSMALAIFNVLVGSVVLLPNNTVSVVNGTDKSPSLVTTSMFATLASDGAYYPLSATNDAIHGLFINTTVSLLTLGFNVSSTTCDTSVQEETYAFRRRTLFLAYGVTIGMAVLVGTCSLGESHSAVQF